MDKTKLALGVALVAVVIAIGGYFYPSASALFGSASPTGPFYYSQAGFNAGAAFGNRSQSYFDSSGKLTVGASGTATTQIISGTCNLAQATPGSFAASTTAQFLCPVTGVASGDLVIADLPVGAGANLNGSGSTGLGFAVVSAYATSSNYIGITLANLTGASTSTFPQATTTVEYRVIR